VIGTKIKSKDKAFLNKMVKEYIKDNGSIFVDMEVANLYMKMEVNMKEIFTRIRNRGMVY